MTIRFAFLFLICSIFVLSGCGGVETAEELPTGNTVSQQNNDPRMPHVATSGQNLKMMMDFPPSFEAQFTVSPGMTVTSIYDTSGFDQETISQLQLGNVLLTSQKADPDESKLNLALKSVDGFELDSSDYKVLKTGTAKNGAAWSIRYAEDDAFKLSVYAEGVFVEDTTVYGVDFILDDAELSQAEARKLIPVLSKFASSASLSGYGE